MKQTDQYKSHSFWEINKTIYVKQINFMKVKIFYLFFLFKGSSVQLWSFIKMINALIAKN